MAGWGADVPDAKRDELIAYLVKNFGPDNDRWKPCGHAARWALRVSAG